MGGTILFRFEKEQKIIEIGGVKLGGQPGELPTVLIGSLFHRGHRIVRNREKGIFDRDEAERLIRLQEEFSEKTGNPCMVDVVAETSEALERYIDFVSEKTDAPLLINGPNAEVRLKAAMHAREVGLIDRAVYNSVNFTVTEEEIEKIRGIGLGAGVIQAFNPRNLRPEGMLKILRGDDETEGLLSKAFRAGIEKPMVLTSVFDVPSIGFGVEAVHMVKSEFGLPAGTAPVGVVGTWDRVRELGRDAKRVCRAGSAALAQSVGADFIIYGSMAKAENIFPVCAMVDAAIAYNAKNLGIKTLSKNHPLLKIF